MFEQLKNLFKRKKDKEPIRIVVDATKATDKLEESTLKPKTPEQNAGGFVESTTVCGASTINVLRGTQNEVSQKIAEYKQNRSGAEFQILGTTWDQSNNEMVVILLYKTK